LSDVEQENGCPIEFSVILGYPVIHGKPLHPEMGVGILVIELAYHGI
jgi:hypothetical protein